MAQGEDPLHVHGEEMAGSERIPQNRSIWVAQREDILVSRPESVEIKPWNPPAGGVASAEVPHERTRNDHDSPAMVGSSPAEVCFFPINEEARFQKSDGFETLSPDGARAAFDPVRVHRLMASIFHVGNHVAMSCFHEDIGSIR